jgi:ATP-dependent Clp protease ATP-binding subunit ClpA
MAWKLSKFVAAVIERASDEARGRNHDYLSSEHIFLELLKTDKSIAQKLLHHFSLTNGMVIAQIDQISQRGGSTVACDCSFPKTQSAKTSLDVALHESAENGCSEIDQIHLMIGLLHESRELLSLPDRPDRMCNIPNVLTQSLKNVGLNLEVARNYVRQCEPRPNRAG